MARLFDRPRLPTLEALLVSTRVVAVGELGDKTQLLTLVLAARFRRPWPIIAGILVATLANHALAAWTCQWVRDTVSPDILRWGLALSFFAVVAWALKPDRFDEADAPSVSDRSVFAVKVVAFFLAEIGDKTQIATAMLAAKFDSLVAVAARRQACCPSTRRRHSSATRRVRGFLFAPFASWRRHSSQPWACGCWPRRIS